MQYILVSTLLGRPVHQLNANIVNTNNANYYLYSCLVIVCYSLVPVHVCY